MLIITRRSSAVQRHAVNVKFGLRPDALASCYMLENSKTNNSDALMADPRGHPEE